MLYKSLLCTLLLATSTTYTMEIVKDSELNKKIYALFITNQETEALIALPRNDENATTSLFVHGVTTNNSLFMQWLLDTKKPLFDSPYMQSALKTAENYTHDKIYLLLDGYIREKKFKLTQELDTYAKTQREYIAQYQYLAQPELATETIERCLSNLTILMRSSSK